LCTGLHGFHVIVGNTALIATAYRMYLGHFTRAHHVGFELAAWYWHFVDVVWLFLYIIIYCWGSNMIGPVISQINDNSIYVIYYWC
jgi:heme/copper-type cytochrome/quinol oxidase subunit 3